MKRDQNDHGVNETYIWIDLVYYRSDNISDKPMKLREHSDHASFYA